MTVTALPKSEPASTATSPGDQRGLTLRSFVVCIFALLLMGIWVEYEECFVMGGPLVENSPPNGAIGVILILLLIGALLYRFRKSFGLVRAELVVIYAALLIAAPLMTQGLWHRIFGLLASLPHNNDFISYESLPDMLWPHGRNLISNGRFQGKTIEPFAHRGGGKLDWDSIKWKQRSWDAPRLSNGDDPKARAMLVITIPRYDANKKEQLVPGEAYLFSCLMKAADLQRTSYYYVKMQTDDGLLRNVKIDSAETPVTFANPGKLSRFGINPLTIPNDLRDSLTLYIGLHGPGTLTVFDVEFFSMRAVEAMYTGMRIVKASKWDDHPINERDYTIKRPDNLFTPAGLGYLLTGFIPLDQWVRPMIAWSLLIGALFMGFFGFNVLMRRQWVEGERFTFPMNIVPRQLLGEEAGDNESGIMNLFRNRIMWLGFVVILPLCIMKGLHFYNPGIPAPLFGDTWTSPRLDTYFNDPNLKLLFQNVALTLTFSLLAIALLIETEILFSMWSMFMLFQVLFVFGKVFNWNRFNSYPWQWQQSIGSFIGYALLAIYAGRRHLARTFKYLIGKAKIDDSSEVVSYRTALALLCASLVLLAIWGAWTKMGAWVSLIFFGWMLVCGFTASKIRAEAGMPTGYWMPYFGMFFVSAVGGFAVFGATGMLVATIASGFMCVSCFLFIAPAQVEMMELGRNFKVRPRDIGWGMTIGLFGGLLIGGFVLLCWGYGFGSDNLTYQWPYGQNWYFNNYRVAEMRIDTLYVANPQKIITPSTAPLNFVSNVDAKGIGIGIVVTAVIAALRGLFMWFPFHPLGYVLSTTYFASTFCFTAFLAWIIRSLILRIGGVHAIRKGLVPFSVGMFLACIVSIVLFDVVGIYLRSLGVMQVYSQWP